MKTVQDNKSSGSLHVGTTAGEHVWKEGDKIRIEGEQVERTVSYIMGKGEKTNICFAKAGPVPKGEVKYTIVRNHVVNIVKE